jgi:hypothetical protein
MVFLSVKWRDFDGQWSGGHIIGNPGLSRSA